MNKELLGATVFVVLFVALFTTLLVSAPSINDVKDIDRPLTAEQQEYYGFNQ